MLTVHAIMLRKPDAWDKHEPVNSFLSIYETLLGWFGAIYKAPIE